MPRLTALLLALALLLAGCVPYGPATRNGNTIHNPTLGYDGYRITLPANLQPAPAEALPGSPLAQLQAQFRQPVKTGEYPIDFTEDFLFQDPASQIAVGLRVNVHALPNPLNQLSLDGKNTMLYSKAGSLGLARQGVDSELVMVDEHAGILIHDKNPFSTLQPPRQVTSICIVIGEVSEIYYVLVIGPSVRFTQVRALAQDVCNQLEL